MSNRVCTLRRPVTHRALSDLASLLGVSQLEAQVLVSRGDTGARLSLPVLLKQEMLDLALGAGRITQAIARQEPIVVVADYDSDGATACAVAVSGLRTLGAQVSFVVPDRMVHGYGISPSVVDLALEAAPDARILLTVDNGILGHAGIAYANERGLDVIVTDHHLPGDSRPPALAVIDPAQPACPSGLCHLAGVGVALWLVSAVKRQILEAGGTAPSLVYLLPYVALGTVADMVRLDPVNRCLVSAGLDQIRRGKAPVGIAALLKEAGCPAAYLTTQDIGFSLAPRLNAAGRLETMDSGIELLLTSDADKAKTLARLLTETNEERKRLQREAVEGAELALTCSFTEDCRCLVQGSADWHPGIVGLVASRLKETYYRPSFAFALSDDGAKGSGRSIPGFHLKDALEEVARRAPGVLAKFGGHAMAAGATLTSAQALDEFKRVFSAVANERISAEMLENTLWSDGPLPELTLNEAAGLLRHPWGQGFDYPAFDDTAVLSNIKGMGSQGVHWKALATVPGHSKPVEVVLFNQPEPPAGSEVQLYLTPGLNTWKGSTSLQWQARVLH